MTTHGEGCTVLPHRPLTPLPIQNGVQWTLAPVEYLEDNFKVRQLAIHMPPCGQKISLVVADLPVSIFSIDPGDIRMCRLWTTAHVVNSSPAHEKRRWLDVHEACHRIPSFSSAPYPRFLSLPPPSRTSGSQLESVSLYPVRHPVVVAGVFGPQLTRGSAGSNIQKCIENPDAISAGIEWRWLRIGGDVGGGCAYFCVASREAKGDRWNRILTAHRDIHRSRIGSSEKRHLFFSIAFA